MPACPSSNRQRSVTRFQQSRLGLAMYLDRQSKDQLRYALCSDIATVPRPARFLRVKNEEGTNGLAAEPRGNALNARAMEEKPTRRPSPKVPFPRLMAHRQMALAQSRHVAATPKCNCPQMQLPQCEASAPSGYSAAARCVPPSAPDARAWATWASSSCRTLRRISSVCSPSSGDRFTSDALSDILIGLPTDK
jgi:hypothetical protein